jgi:hypothetical protein
MRTRLGLPAFFLACVLGLAGCEGGNKFYPVEGTVTVDGNPIEGATVVFTSGDGTSSSGLTSASGKFKLLTNGKEGAPGGTYKVSVAKTVSQTVEAGSESAPAGKMYEQYLKASGGVRTSGSQKGGAEKPKSEIPERYNKPGTIPDQVVPTSGPVTLELKSK